MSLSVLFLYRPQSDKALSIPHSTAALNKMVKPNLPVSKNNLSWGTRARLTSKTPVTSMSGISSAFTQYVSFLVSSTNRAL